MSPLLEKILLHSSSVKDEDYLDLSVISDEPFTPPCTEVMPMNDEFHPDRFIDGFVRNAISRRVLLTGREWRVVTSYFLSDFSIISKKIGLQLLYLLSKADGDELAVAKRGFRDLVNAMMLPLEALKVERLDNERAVMAKEFLSLPLIIETIKRALVAVDLVDGEDFSDLLIRDTISSMAMYTGYGLPLRGACLLDGIFICFSQIGGCEDTERDMADFFTLICHETVHYVIRSICNNYNFSSPFTQRIAPSLARKDPKVSGKNLESGRFAEITIFGMQPNWRESTMEAAKLFLRLIQDPNQILPLPLEQAGLIEREFPSLSFGIDMDLALFRVYGLME